MIFQFFWAFKTAGCIVLQVPAVYGNLSLSVFASDVYCWKFLMKCTAESILQSYLLFCFQLAVQREALLMVWNPSLAPFLFNWYWQSIITGIPTFVGIAGFKTLGIWKLFFFFGKTASRLRGISTAKKKRKRKKKRSGFSFLSGSMLR